MTDKDRLSTADKALLKAASTGEGAVPLTRERLETISGWTPRRRPSGRSYSPIRLGEIA